MNKNNIFSFTGSIVFCFSVCFPLNGCAITQYRCDGKVQYRPCGERLHRYERNVYTPKQATKPEDVDMEQVRAAKRWPLASSRGLEVVNAAFHPLPGARGMWKGRVRGSGKIGLRLIITREDKVVANRFMGAITLRGPSSSYRYIGSVPRSPGWDWRVVAREM